MTRKQGEVKAAMKRGKKYITLKIALRGTEIARTVVVPDDVTLMTFSSALNEIFGWHGGHLWEFQVGRDISYVEPSEYDSEFEGICERRDAGRTTLAKAFPERGSKMIYLYDMGDSWEHEITRMADPKEPGTCCKKTTGTFGLDDVGGCWGLVDFIERLKKYDANPEKEIVDDLDELLEWSGLDDEGARRAFLAGPDVPEITGMLRKGLGA